MFSVKTDDLRRRKTKMFQQMVKNFTYLIATEHSTCDTVKQLAEVKPHYFQLTRVCFLALTCQKEGIPEILLLLLQHSI